MGGGRTEDGNAVRESYVNLIPTPAGGIVNRACAKACSARRSRASPSCTACLPKGVCPRTCLARQPLSVKVLDPQFQGQIANG